MWRARAIRPASRIGASVVGSTVDTLTGGLMFIRTIVVIGTLIQRRPARLYPVIRFRHELRDPQGTSRGAHALTGGYRLAAHRLPDRA